MKTVLLIGTLDTKGPEYAFVRDLIHARGVNTIVMDLGTLGEPSFAADIPADEVAKRGGSWLAEIRERGDRGEAIDIMLNGARALTREAFEATRFDGVIGLGGGGGTAMITAAMRELPVGVPKLMVSTMASGNTAPYVDVKDITMMYSVVDIAGLNAISRAVLANAAGAICGMVVRRADGATDAASRSGERGRGERAAIAATMFGVTTPCVT